MKNANKEDREQVKANNEDNKLSSSSTVTCDQIQHQHLVSRARIERNRHLIKWPTIALLLVTTRQEYIVMVEHVVNLEARNLWHVIENDKAERSTDRLALAAVRPTKESAKAAWEAMKKMHGVARVQEVNVQPSRMVRLLTSFQYKFPYILANTIQAPGESMDQVHPVKKFLNIVPERYTRDLAQVEYYDVEELVKRLIVKEDYWFADRLCMTSSYRNQQGNDLIHGHLCRPIMSPTPDNKNYYLLTSKGTRRSDGSIQKKLKIEPNY
uniref:Uncharacterized protein n=1 Tax=Kalanchoe fedtschenkoi TaxID=63787 RepID=A0A7N0ZS01_KALFE